MGNATQFVPLTSSLIDEGVFLDDLDQELLELQDAISRFQRQHGTRSKGAKAKLQIDLEMSVEGDGDEAVFAIKSSMKTTLPKKPASVSMAIGGNDENGKLALFVRKSGGDEVHPRQMKLATKDGKVIDPDSGEVLDNA